MESHHKLRSSRCFYNNEPITDNPERFGLTYEEIRQIRLPLLRHPCPCGALDGVLISADIDIAQKKVLSWEMPFETNDMYEDVEFSPGRQWRKISYCPFCGNPLIKD